MLLHSRTSRWVTLALAVVWVSTVASADAVLTPVMHCHNMPCCPRSDGGMQECSTAQCAEQTPERAESQAVAKEAGATSSPATALPTEPAIPRLAAPRLELTQGLRFSAAVFRLKDDLRI